MISVENALSEERFVLELPTSRAVLATARHSRFYTVKCIAGPSAIAELLVITVICHPIECRQPLW